MTERGQLPRAYLRLDPNIDSIHPDWEGMVKLMLVANRQPVRGYFKTWDLVVIALGSKARANRFLARRDVVRLPDGRFHLEGWELWQEGDFTVGERMRRLREKRHGSVTSDGAVTDAASPASIRPSEASRRLGDNTPPPSPPARGGGGNGHETHRAEIRQARDQVTHRVAQARQYVLDNGGRVPRYVERQLKSWAKAGHTLAEIQEAIDRGEHLPRRRL